MLPGERHANGSNDVKWYVTWSCADSGRVLHVSEPPFATARQARTYARHWKPKNAPLKRKVEYRL